MEQNILKLELENSKLLLELLPRFNRIYNYEINTQQESGTSITLRNIENVSMNDLFILGGFYGTAVYKNRKKGL
jgi:hypothetical protein